MWALNIPLILPEGYVVNYISNLHSVNLWGSLIIFFRIIDQNVDIKTDRR